MMTKILARSPALRQLCEGEWVRLSLVHPATGDTSTFDPARGFVPWQPRQARLAHVGRSADWYRGFRGFLAPALVEPHEIATSEAREELSGGV
jgi:hypothetical protein